MSTTWPPKFVLLIVCLVCTVAAHAALPPNLLEESFDGESSGARLSGDAAIIDFGKLEKETGGKSVALNSAVDGNKDGRKEGAITFQVGGLAGSEGKWFRFSFRGLPAKDFVVGKRDDLAMRVKFFGRGGKEPLDGVVKEFYEDIESDRKNLDRNGLLFQYGSAVWTTYSFDFRLPFNDIDTVELSVAFQNGSGLAPYGSLFVDDVRLESVARENAVLARPEGGTPAIDEARLMPLGGHWYYVSKEGETVAPRHFDSENFDRLVYRTGKSDEFPFARNRGTWMRQGFKDAEGRLISADEWIRNPVEVDFESGTMIIRSHNIPNHPTGVFPGYLGNRSFIQEQQVVVYLPLDPQPNPRAVAMTARNANNALKMGPTGIAVNGVVFYNPFDANMEEAVHIMDRCCGHPDPRNMYHYHKYPVCARSPFEDQGATHSPLIGWAYDGFPVYGPYEGNGEMAMDSKSNPLNEFNIHRDDDRGWHYHVTPGKFPYIIGGYWGEFDRRNFSPRRR